MAKTQLAFWSLAAAKGKVQQKAHELTSLAEV